MIRPLGHRTLLSAAAPRGVRAYRVQRLVPLHDAAEAVQVLAELGMGKHYAAVGGRDSSVVTLNRRHDEGQVLHDLSEAAVGFVEDPAAYGYNLSGNGDTYLRSVLTAAGPDAALQHSAWNDFYLGVIPLDAVAASGGYAFALDIERLPATTAGSSAFSAAGLAAALERRPGLIGVEFEVPVDRDEAGDTVGMLDLMALCGRLNQPLDLGCFDCGAALEQIVDATQAVPFNVRGVRTEAGADTPTWRGVELLLGLDGRPAFSRRRGQQLVADAWQRRGSQYVWVPSSPPTGTEGIDPSDAPALVVALRAPNDAPIFDAFAQDDVEAIAARLQAALGTTATPEVLT
ncbi:MAG: hypothetical protein HY696_09450 [Deltaproteobacteria bacterium]|nr:hypothetical protein [Deltaproteobacteria bacterium]